MKTWEQRQLAEARKRVRQRYGAVQRILSGSVMDALVQAEVLSIIAMNASFADSPLIRLAELAVAEGMGLTHTARMLQITPQDISLLS